MLRRIPMRGFKGLFLAKAPKKLLAALEDEGDEGRHPTEAARLALVPAREAARPAAMPRVVAPPAPDSWDFSCGPHMISIRLDGFSHASLGRRAYCKCPFHEKCFKYSAHRTWRVPWLAFASILCYTRAGECVDSKESHRELIPASEEDLAAVEAELPRVLWAPSLLVEL